MPFFQYFNSVIQEIRTLDLFPNVNFDWDRTIFLDATRMFLWVGIYVGPIIAIQLSTASIRREGDENKLTAGLVFRSFFENIGLTSLIFSAIIALIYFLNLNYYSYMHYFTEPVGFLLAIGSNMVARFLAHFLVFMFVNCLICGFYCLVDSIGEKRIFFKGFFPLEVAAAVFITVTYALFTIGYDPIV